MIKARIRGNLKAPKFNFQKDLDRIADTIIIPRMAELIHQRKDISGKKYASLSPVTIKMKGGDTRPLIHTGTLVSSFFAKKKGKNKVLVSLDKSRKEIGKHLQIDGIKTKKGKRFFEFFGISKDMEKRAIKYMRDRINKAIKNVR